jgi:hypothetical protein
MGGATARSTAMGSTGASLHHGTDALILNPAALLPAAGQARLDLSLGLEHLSEDRSVPLYDSFQSYVTDVIVGLNRNVYGAASGGGLWRLPVDMPMTVAGGVFDRWDLDYEYFEEFRDPAETGSNLDQVLEYREIAQEGHVRSASVGYGVRPWGNLQLGVSGHRYFGDATREASVVDAQTGDRVAVSATQDLAGWGYTVGAWGRVHERIDVGVSFEGPFQLDGGFNQGLDSLGTVTQAAFDRAVDYPGTLRFGLTYHPRNVLRTTFAVEMERRFWESEDQPAVGVFDDSIATRDTWDFRLGLEHVFYNQLPVRFGFRYLENYADPESERSIYSVGVGYRLAGFDVEATGLYHRQTSRQPFLFDPSYLSSQAPGSDQKVDDTVVQVLFGVARTF